MLDHSLVREAAVYEVSGVKAGNEVSGVKAGNAVEKTSYEYGANSVLLKETRH